ncbi:MAG: addiction module protein [Planctomycetota bacterium]
MSDTDRLLQEALKLPEAQRAALAGTLIESLDTDVDPDAEAAWAVEIARRVAELDEGTVRVVPWTEARKRILGD